MREFKFRAWDGEQMHYSGVAGLAVFFGVFDDDLMQYTGLKDKNGVEIYEGDIIRYEDGDVRKVSIGGFFALGDQVGFGVHYTLADEGQEAVTASPLGIEKHWEVIGNIYENPELLNA